MSCVKRLLDTFNRRPKIELRCPFVGDRKAARFQKCAGGACLWGVAFLKCPFMGNCRLNYRFGGSIFSIFPINRHRKAVFFPQTDTTTLFLSHRQTPTLYCRNHELPRPDAYLLYEGTYLLCVGADPPTNRHYAALKPLPVNAFSFVNDLKWVLNNQINDCQRAAWFDRIYLMIDNNTTKQPSDIFYFLTSFSISILRFKT